jgi:hypothetical protein
MQITHHINVFILTEIVLLTNNNKNYSQWKLMHNNLILIDKLTPHFSHHHYMTLFKTIGGSYFWIFCYVYVHVISKFAFNVVNLNTICYLTQFQGFWNPIGHKIRIVEITTPIQWLTLHVISLPVFKFDHVICLIKSKRHNKLSRYRSYKIVVAPWWTILS